MLCRDRWVGLEQEGFGIVFLEAAAAGVPQVAGASGGAAEAVLDGETGHRRRRAPTTSVAVAAAVGRLLDDGELRRRLGAQARGEPRRTSTTTCWPAGSGCAGVDPAAMSLARPRRTVGSTPMADRTTRRATSPPRRSGGHRPDRLRAYHERDRRPEAARSSRRDHDGRARGHVPGRAWAQHSSCGPSTSPAPPQPSWKRSPGGIMLRLDGRYRREPVADDLGTDVTYNLAVQLVVPLPS